MVRSGLICSHVLPKSGVLKTTFPAKYTVVFSCGENTIGEFQLKRYFCPSAGPPPLPRPHGLIDLLLATAKVSPDNIAALRFGKIQVGIVRMIDDVKAVAEADHAPIVVHDAGGLARAAGTGPRTVVLKSAHHVIEGQAIVGVNLIELAQRDVVNSFPRFAAVVRDADAAVLAVPHSFRVFRIDPERVKVDVTAARD